MTKKAACYVPLPPFSLLTEQNARPGKPGKSNTLPSSFTDKHLHLYLSTVPFYLYLLLVAVCGFSETR